MSVFSATSDPYLVAAQWVGSIALALTLTLAAVIVLLRLRLQRQELRRFFIRRQVHPAAHAHVRFGGDFPVMRAGFHVLFIGRVGQQNQFGYLGKRFRFVIGFEIVENVQS